MYQLHPDLAALVARDHYEDLRRAAGEARLNTRGTASPTTAST